MFNKVSADYADARRLAIRGSTHLPDYVLVQQAGVQLNIRQKCLCAIAGCTGAPDLLSHKTAIAQMV